MQKRRRRPYLNFTRTEYLRKRCLPARKTQKYGVTHNSQPHNQLRLTPFPHVHNGTAEKPFSCRERAFSGVRNSTFRMPENTISHSERQYFTEQHIPFAHFKEPRTVFCCHFHIFPHSLSRITDVKIFYRQKRIFMHLTSPFSDCHIPT